MKIDNKTEDKSNTFTLNPTRLNPFVKGDSSEETESSSKNGSSEISNNGQSETPKFMPLSTTESSKQSTSANSVSSNPNFVFGQNLHERIVAESENNTENATESNSSQGQGSKKFMAFT